MPTFLHGLMPLTLIPAALTGEVPALLGGGVGVSTTRRCGRCLAEFPADPDADPVVIPEFWMCPPCRKALLGKLAAAGATVGPARHLRAVR